MTDDKNSNYCITWQRICLSAARQTLRECSRKGVIAPTNLQLHILPTVHLCPSHSTHMLTFL